MGLGDCTFLLLGGAVTIERTHRRGRLFMDRRKHLMWAYSASIWFASKCLEAALTWGVCMPRVIVWATIPARFALRDERLHMRVHTLTDLAVVCMTVCFLKGGAAGAWQVWCLLFHLRINAL